MTAVVRPGPTPLSRVWTSRKVVAEDLTGEDLGDVLELHSDAYAWWVLPAGDDYGAAELRSVAGALGLDALAVHDLLAHDRRAKFEAVGTARLVTTNAVTVDEEQVGLAVHPVSVVVTDRALICLAGDTPGFRPAALLAGHEAELAAGGVESALQALLVAVVASYESAVQWLEDAADELTATLFDERPLTRPEQLRAFRLRAALSQLRRLTEPMRGVLGDLVSSPGPTHGKKAVAPSLVTRRWTLLAERHARAAGGADALRESYASILQTSLALSDLRMNETMRKLTGWAAIIAVPTLVTGFAGMNVSFPLDGTVAGFWLYLAVLLGASAVLYVLFRRKHWV